MTKLNVKLLVLFSCITLVVLGCKTAPNELNKSLIDHPETTSQEPLKIKSDYLSGDLTRRCDVAIKDFDQAINLYIKNPPSNTGQRLKIYDELTTQFSNQISPLRFMKNVSTQEALRKEAQECEIKSDQIFVDLMTRKDLYQVLKNDEPTTQDLIRLKVQTLKEFKKNGLDLDDAQLAEVRNLKKQLTEVESQFSTNLGNDTTSITLTKDELAGVPDSILERFEKTADHQYLIKLKSSNYVALLENVKSSDVRKKVAILYGSRQAESNTKLLIQAIELRKKIAQIIGYSQWGDLKIQGQMAQNSKNVIDFLNPLKSKLAQATKKDIDVLKNEKRHLFPKEPELHPWDIAYISRVLKETKYAIDDEKLREYFPADYVVAKMFDIYSTLLGVEFQKNKTPQVWDPSVQEFLIIDQTTKKVLARFYTDFIPRDGKYGHAAAFTLQSKFATAQTEVLPVSAIVANFTKPAEGQPALLSHDEVETLFHEFGHIMHQTLTQVKLGSLSGTAVTQDFVEAPSQMLENWVWDKKILKQISKHYQTGKPLSDKQIAQMIKSKNFNNGLNYTKQLVYALIDMNYHTLEGARTVQNPNEEYKKLHAELLGFYPVEGTNFPATFGHLMGGYDANYYGYLWSEVYAQDMFSRFEKEGLLSSKVGKDYRHIILERGDLQNPMELITEFLGRKPNVAAFYKKLNIK
jgi:thimet oligopeptidase